MAIYYHASQTPDIQILEPRVSNHGIPLIYFSEKRENVLVYLSNAVEKYCKETGFQHTGPWEKWGPYGFDREGKLRFEEYYPDALRDTYQGVSGYIYTAEAVESSGDDIQIPNAATSKAPVKVTGCEFIPDAYEAILEAERAGLISIFRYEDAAANEKWRNWIMDTMKREYENATEHPEYQHFIRGKFGITDT